MESDPRNVPPAPVPRACGECTECCTIVPVAEIQKAAWERCAHLAQAPSQGCALHPNWPAPCAKYRCAWLRSMPGLEDDDRPDQLGLVISTYRVQDEPRIEVVESWPYALHQARARRIAGILIRQPQVRVLVRLHGALWSLVFRAGVQEAISVPTPDTLLPPPGQVQEIVKLLTRPLLARV